jgi:fucose permease
MKEGSALLIMGIAGGAILPLAYSWLSNLSSPQMGYLLLVPIYLYILYFAIRGHLLRD